MTSVSLCERKTRPFASSSHRIHIGADEALDGVIGTHDNGFVLVEAGVQHHWHTRQVLEVLDGLPVERICSAADGLQPTGAVDVGGGRDLATSGLVNPVHLE